MKPAVSILPIALIVLLWLLFFWRILTPVEADRLTFQQGDFTLQFLAYRQMAFRQLLAGRFPVFEECLYSGYPFQADPQSQVLYPPVLGLMLLGRALGWSEYPLRALEWEVMLHVLIAALAMYAFLRLANRRGNSVWLPSTGDHMGRRSSLEGSPLHRVAAMIGAVAYAFSGFMTGYAMLQTAILETAAWLPLILLALKWLATSRRWLPSAVLLAVSVFFASTAGHPQTLLFVVYTGAIAFIFWFCDGRRGVARSAWIRDALARGGTASLFAIGLSATQLIPTLSFTLASTRASLPFAEAGRGFVLHDIALFALTGVINVWQPIYVGIVTLALAMVALYRPRQRDVWLWVIIGIGALVLGFGANAFGFDTAYLVVPGYRQFQSQERHAVIITLSLSMLAAYGAQALLRPLRLRALARLRRAARGLSVWAGVAFAALFFVLVAARVFPQADLGVVSDRVAMIVIGLFGAAALFAWRSRLGQTPRWLWVLGVLALLVFDLFTVNRFTATQPPADPFPTLKLTEPIQRTPTPNTNVQLTRVYNHFGLPLNGACMRGLNEVAGGSPIVLRDYQTFLDRVPEDVMTKLLNVRYAVTWRGAMTTPEGKEIPWFLLARDRFEGKEASTYRLDWEPHNTTGAWIPKQVVAAKSQDEIFDAMRQDNFDPFTTALTLDPSAAPFNGANVNGSAAVEGKVPGYMKVTANADAPALLALSEAYHWNWIAMVNGKETRPIPVDGALLGVPIPAGSSTIELSYRPIDLWVGAAISAVTLILMISLLVLDARRAHQAVQAVTSSEARDLRRHLDDGNPLRSE